jgi:D-alanyl-D-alanine carboxypeptidase
MRVPSTFIGAWYLPKRRFWGSFAAVLILAGATCTQAEAARAVSRRRVSEILINASTGNIIYAVQPDALHHPASLTKMMTLYLVFDALDAGRIRLDDSVKVSSNAARQPASKLGISPGSTFNVQTALRAVAVHSANDVAVALAEKIAGSEARFVVEMNAKAQLLGMRHTIFANASGLTNVKNITTARDMALLSRAILRNHSRYYSVFGRRSIRWRSKILANHNHLLGKVDGVDGIKTGYTADAGFNIAASAKRHGERVIAVVLGAPAIQARDVRVANLLELGFIRSATDR